MSQKTFSPGEKAPRSGQYEIIGPRGGETGKERTVTRHEPLCARRSDEALALARSS
jgi:hypothetical protein